MSSTNIPQPTVKIRRYLNLDTKRTYHVLCVTNCGGWADTNIKITPAQVKRLRELGVPYTD